MNRIPLADWAAQVPWSGVFNKPSWVGTSGPLVDLSGVTWNGVPAGYFPFWNGLRFVPTVVAIGPGGGGTKIKDGDQPALAVRRRPPGNPFGEFENVWQRFVFNVKLYGAAGTGIDDLQAINSAIADLNAAGMGMLYFPAGRYACSQPPDRISGFAMVKGDGIGVTTLIFEGGNGLTFDPSSADQTFGAEGFAIEQVGTAISVRGGVAHIRDLGIECTQVGLEMGLPTAPLSMGSVEGSYFLSAGTAATAIRAYGDGLDIHDVTVMGSGEVWDHGITLEAGLAAAFHDVFVSMSAHEAIFLGTAVSGARVQNIVFEHIQGAHPVLDQGTHNYVNELFGLGFNTNSDFDDRKELYSIFNWGPGTVAPGFGFFDDFAVPGANLGDQCVLGAPLSFYEGVSTDIRVVAVNTVRATLFNLGTALADFTPANWKMRIFN